MKPEIQFYGNLYSCPTGKRKPDCPVINYENLSFAEKVKWFDGLVPEEQKSVMEYHKKCVAKR